MNNFDLKKNVERKNFYNQKFGNFKKKTFFGKIFKEIENKKQKKFLKKKNLLNFVRKKKINKLKYYWKKLSGVFPIVFTKITKIKNDSINREIDLTKKKLLF